MRGAHTAYSLCRMKGYQQVFRSLGSFGFGGQKSASKPPQAICKPLAFIDKIFERIYNNPELRLNDSHEAKHINITILSILRK